MNNDIRVMQLYQELLFSKENLFDISADIIHD